MDVPPEPGFAPTDLTDRRDPLDWKSKYEIDAQKDIWKEAWYLGSLLAVIPLAMTTLWIISPGTGVGLEEDQYFPILKYALAWLGGTLGGTLFSLKWLYHSVAHQRWHLDRRLWRLFTPHISGGLAFAVIALISSGILIIFDQEATDSLSLIVGAAFLVGYFSDNAIAKLYEVAQTLFGANPRDVPRRSVDNRPSPDI